MNTYRNVPVKEIVNQYQAMLNCEAYEIRFLFGYYIVTIQGFMTFPPMTLIELIDYITDLASDDSLSWED